MTYGTTETDAALISSIRLYFAPRQLLTPDSVLGKTLIEKYGQPTEHSDPESASDLAGGGRMFWSNPDLGGNGPEVIADCNGSTKKQCELTVEDGGVVSMERSRQADIDKKRMRDSQPKTAPEL